MKGEKDKKLIIEQLKKTPIIEVACQKAGVARATFYRWKAQDPEFARQADEALSEGLLLMNDLAESQLLSAIRDKNLGALTFWLKHRHEAYRNKVEISGRFKHSYEELSEEDKQLVREALKLGLSMETSEQETPNQTYE